MFGGLEQFKGIFVWDLFKNRFTYNFFGMAPIDFWLHKYF